MVSKLFNDIKMLRTRNQFIVNARCSSTERRHALALVVHVREQDLEHLNGLAANSDATNSDDYIDIMQHVLELLDSDAAFASIVRELDAPRAPTDAAKSNKSSAIAMTATISSPHVHVQWRIVDPSLRAVPNVLAATRRPRSECFSRASTASVAANARSSDEVYDGGLFAPVPMRKLTLELWIYPSHVTIPSTGDPQNSSCVTDFFMDE